ncbi:uncharacterized protein LAJ45_00164 [Morchella importuna]|uniref:SnoaL-like domain-containing protein n=1 Tax=Morchella conica CCBAS932 TaxID=1392247 RepID=A0A3N4KSC1_9PEZI|nr:uncharacterized protein LAJ45_00164 [Morchella importuna]KAH8155155.1 hypothetical protein LAJ45_00164 [Morchella importuna]RPB08655.1 hypothetical protein P167DRAFT_560436 [Morchella conica CCBAS932]
MASYDSLKTAATSLCTAFATEQPPSTLLTHFSTTPPPIAHEHGLPCLAPFVGREFRGANEVAKYFGILADQLSFRNMEFDDYVVDTREQKVSVRGRSRFVWTATGEAWNEVFTYTLGFVEEDGEIKVSKYEVWADTGAAYLARKGKLKECETQND